MSQPMTDQKSERSEAFQRAVRVLKWSAVLAVLGLAYLLFFMHTGLGIPCVFRLVTGLKCPGCGVTHMLVDLLRLDFAGAWRENAALMCLLPVGVGLAIYALYVYIRTGSQPRQRWYDGVILAMVAVLLVYGVVRNL